MNASVLVGGRRIVHDEGHMETYVSKVVLLVLMIVWLC